MWKLVTIAAFAILWAFIVTVEVDGKKQKTGCNNTFLAKNGAFDLNDHTLKNHSCYFIIKPENNTDVIGLAFFNVFLHGNDMLNVYKNLSDAESGINPLLEKPIQSQNGTISLIISEPEVVVYLYGSDKFYERTVDGFYTNHECIFPINADAETLYSPSYVGNFTEPVECHYNFNEIQHERVKQVFTFKEFSMLQSTITIDGSTLSSNANSGEDFFFAENKKIMSIDLKQALNSTDHFELKMHTVDKACSGKYEIPDSGIQLHSPHYELNNGSITKFECRWLVQHNGNGKKVLGLEFDKLDFNSVFDIVAINDGGSEFSPPLLQVTKSNRNITRNQVIRGSSTSLWISFKPLSYESYASFNVSVHGQGGYFKNSGNIKMEYTTGGDTVFLLQVKDKEVVILNFEDSSIKPPATVFVYDGFDTSNLLASLHGQVKYPVISRSSRMMVTATKSSDKSDHFSANFQGTVPGCNFMNSLAAESYILSESCNTSCMWVIPPQNSSDSVLVLYLQYISLKEGDYLKIHKLDDKLTELVTLKSNETKVPHISVPADVGLLVNVTQASCKKKEDKIVLIAHPSYIPACGYSIAPKGADFLQLSSPLYPDTYPVFSSCHWNISAPNGSVVHMSFQNVSLAKNHCIKISQKSSKFVEIIEGKELPNDLFFLSGDVDVDFDSSGCNKTEVDSVLKSDSGFLLNVTVADCGSVLDGRPSGAFNMSGVKTVCIWKVSVPPSTKQDSANIVSYKVEEEKSKLKNYELHVYDGLSVRDSEILNNSDTQIWSRTNTLIFVYKRLNTSQPSGTLFVKYESQSCNTLCDNKICMHSDWRCDGKNDCGDFSDERNCGSVPIPPEIQYTGYSATAFWLCIAAMLVLGAILGVVVPVCFQRYRDSRYRRFHELES